MASSEADPIGRHALGETDRIAAEAVSGALARVRTLVEAGIEGTDLFSAASRLGADLATNHATPTLASATSDAIGRLRRRDDIGESDEGDGALATSAGLRAALHEGYARRKRELEDDALVAAFDFESASVDLGGGRIAIAALLPTTDRERIVAWAARIAASAARGDTRIALVFGRDDLRAALIDALHFVGIRVDPESGAHGTQPGAAPRSRFWSRLFGRERHR